MSEDMTALAEVLSSYAAGLRGPDPDDVELFAAADALRRSLELVYGWRMTFKDEKRAAARPEITGEAQADRLLGDVAGVRARLAKSAGSRGRGPCRDRRAGRQGLWRERGHGRLRRAQ